MVILNEVELKEIGSRAKSRSAYWKYLSCERSNNSNYSNSSQQQFNDKFKMNCIDRKSNNHKNNFQPYQRMSTYGPNFDKHTDLMPDCVDETASIVHTYASIDPQRLSHLNYNSNYCTSMSSSGSLANLENENENNMLSNNNHYLSHHDKKLYGHQECDVYNTFRSNTDEKKIKQPIEKHEDIGFGFTLLSLLNYLIDLWVQATLVYLFYHEKNKIWFKLFLSFLIIPSLIVNLLSLKWYLQDIKSSKIELNITRKPKISTLNWLSKIAAHSLLLGLVSRYIDLLCYAYKIQRLKKKSEKVYRQGFYLSILQQSANLQNANNMERIQQETDERQNYINYYLLTINEDRDTAFLSLLKSFVQSAPLIVLNTLILSSKSDFTFESNLEIFELISITVSSAEISRSLVAYNRAMRRSLPTKKNFNAIGLTLQILWRFLTISTRLISIGLFITAFNYWIIPIAIGHWGIMTIWVMHQGTNFCSNDQAEYFFCMIIGAIYLVCFLNIKDEPTRCKYISYYLLVWIENIFFSSLWYIKWSSLKSQSTHLNYLLIYTGLLSTYIMGIIFMIIYHKFFHPGRSFLNSETVKSC